MWRLHPNGGRVAVISLPRADAKRVMERGWLTIDGCRAMTGEILCDEPIPERTAFRILFDEPYPYPHP